MRAWLPLFLLLGLGASGRLPQPDWPRIDALPIALDRAGITNRVGRLRFLGGWRLVSRNPRFGGVSSLIAERGGLTALGDQGGVFRLVERGGRVTGRVRGIVPDGPPSRFKRFGRDIESVAVDPATGRRWLGYEAWKEVWRFDAGLTRSDSHARPPAMNEWPGNGSIEALVRLGDGRFLIFCEACGPSDRPGPALLFAGDPAVPGAQPQLLRYRAPAGYRVADAALLPGGRDLLLLHRRLGLYDGWSAIVAIAPVAAFAPGATVIAREIARLAPPLAVDNMEGLAVTREGARTIVWLAADDNFSMLQQSLLFKFALE